MTCSPPLPCCKLRCILESTRACFMGQAVRAAMQRLCRPVCMCMRRPILMSLLCHFHEAPEHTYHCRQRTPAQQYRAYSDVAKCKAALYIQQCSCCLQHAGYLHKRCAEGCTTAAPAKTPLSCLGKKSSRLLRWAWGYDRHSTTIMRMIVVPLKTAGACPGCLLLLCLNDSMNIGTLPVVSSTLECRGRNTSAYQG